MVLTRSLEMASTDRFLTIFYFAFLWAEPEPLEPEPSEPGKVEMSMAPYMSTFSRNGKVRKKCETGITKKYGKSTKKV